MTEPLERDVQRACVEHARRRGWDVRKFGENGDPDYIFFGPKGQMFLVEFKKHDGQVKALQRKRIKRLRSLGHVVLVVRGAAGRDKFKASFPNFDGLLHSDLF